MLISQCRWLGPELNLSTMLAFYVLLVGIKLTIAGSRRPQLLILDEATSALDSDNERAIQEALEALHGNLTLLVIAHRLATVRHADQVVVLERGRIVETGTWADLAGQDDGYLAAMLARQTLG